MISSASSRGLWRSLKALFAINLTGLKRVRVQSPFRGQVFHQLAYLRAVALSWISTERRHLAGSVL